MKIRSITLIALLVAIVYIQEQLLAFLPNIQFTVLLIMLYSRIMGTKRTILILIIYVFFDTIFQFNFIYAIFMLIGWSIIPISLNHLFAKIKSPISLSLLSSGYAFIYSQIMIIPSLFIYQIDYYSYLISDLPFELLLVVSSFLTVLWLYHPLYNSLDKLLQRSKNS